MQRTALVAVVAPFLASTACAGAAEQRPPRIIVSLDGVWLGARVMPSAGHRLEIGEGHVLALRTSRDGADEIVRFQLRR